MSNRSRPISWVWIILLCLGGACLLTWTASLLGAFTTQEPPAQLPGLPEKAVGFAGIETWSFHQAAPVVQGETGQLYRFDFYEDPLAWEPVQGTEESFDTACAEDAVQTLEKTAGPVSECREVQTLGEWCPGPIKAYALDSDGAVWELESESGCWFINAFIYGASGFLGLIVGIIIVFVRWLVGRRNR